HFSVNTAAVALLARRMGGPAFSFTVHGPDELPGMRANGIADKVRHARAVAAITDYCRGEILAATDGEGADKVHVVRCGLELDRFQPTPVPAASQTLVCVGRLCPQKAQTLLAEAAARLKDSHPQLRILLIGDGDTRPEIEAILDREGLRDRVVLHGWASGDEVRAAIAAARALILPSFAEGLPMVIMEAMALGRPVISTRIAGIPELLDSSCGWIVDAGDVDALTASIAACLEADAAHLDAMGAEGRARVEQRHDQSKNARGLRRAVGLETDADASR
ncbi:MAG: glycosyltransferase family 4 protein, partial [Planctomycetota bacterium]